jgi:hypothetical protein
MLTRGEAIMFRQANKKMRYASAASMVLGVITSALTTVVWVFVEGGAITINGATIDVLTFLHAALFFSLSFFIRWRRSLFAAVMLFVLCLADTLHVCYQAASEVPNLATTLRTSVELLFLYLFFEGVRGAVVYQRLRRKHADEIA